jgi:pimeloyl-ACP methyl ester carboxylesterase
MLRCTIVALCLTGCLTFHKGAMPGEPAGASFVEVEGARVRYVDAGQGPAVVLLHGFASSLETWLTVMPALAQGHRVLALDLKGFGWTDRPEGDYSPEAEARLVLAVMKARGIEDAAVVAHSWGTSVALAMALDMAMAMAMA